jgi:hypothetical protein
MAWSRSIRLDPVSASRQGRQLEAESRTARKDSAWQFLEHCRQQRLLLITVCQIAPSLTRMVNSLTRKGKRLSARK